jgi:RNA polymerase sigma-70 factor (ECF subfamily)
LYEQEAPRLKGLALAICRAAPAAEDVLHDVFLRVWHQAERFDEERGSARAWLTMLVRYRAMEIMRRASREITTTGHNEAPIEPLMAADSWPDPLSELMRNAEGQALHACLSRLGPERAELIQRAFLLGRTHAALAAETGLPLGTVKSMIRRSLALLKKCLEQ